MNIDPIQATNAINKSYLNYLATTFYLSNERLRKNFHDELYQPGRFLKGPILEATPPFKKGMTVGELVEEGVLSDGFNRLKSTALPIDRPLYTHQVEGIRKIVVERRNLVAATGTGSGKTEIFLLPIIDYLLKQHEKKKLDPGVRALLLYPMNALANDQLARLRKLFYNVPEITFGRYTGETEESEKSATEAYRKMYDAEPLPNELLSREQMREAPPHILLTNYAMLEYLLLRPKDNAFFDGIYADSWRFIVLDEAHTYSGAKGIEIAMLLRRLKDRVVKSEPGRIICIATSATLGKGEKDYDGIAKFASNLFGEHFNKSDVVGALTQTELKKNLVWGKPDPKVYIEWQKIIEQDNNFSIKLRQLIESGKKTGIPEKVLFNAETESTKKNDISTFLYEVLKGDAYLIQLQKELKDKPELLQSVAGKVFADFADKGAKFIEQLAVSLVDLAVKARPGEEDQALLPARYHVFVRAIEGAYLSLDPEQILFLSRHEKVHHSGHDYKVAELATCTGCGAHYLVGEIDNQGNGKYFVQPKEDYRHLSYFLMADYDLLEDVDEDEEAVAGSYSSELNKLELYKICAKCGRVDKDNVLRFQCECEEPFIRKLYLVPSKEGKVSTCCVCGRFSPHRMIRRFSVGTDAAASVLTTSLYQQIRPQIKKRKKDNTVELTDDVWSGTAENNAEVDSVPESVGRKLLIFSDNRQDAAFFAPYFNRTYMQILRRNLIVRVLQENQYKALENEWRLQDLVKPLHKKVEQQNILPRMSKQEQINEIWKWLLYELLGFDRRLGLEGLGLVGFQLVKPEHWKAPNALLKEPWNFTENEVWSLLLVMLDSLRIKGAATYPDYVDPGDSFFQPRNKEIYVRGRKTETKKGILSWNSTGGRLNARLDYLIRLVEKTGVEVSREDCRIAMANIWDKVLSLESEVSCWKEHIKPSYIQNEGAVYRLNHELWELKSGIINPDITWYRCDKCQDLALHNIRGICPKYRCEGNLRAFDPDNELAENHYRKLYCETLPLAARSEEHTAQLTSRAASILQTDFIKGKVNILSCSTTFELGVDVGELEAVLMRNVPPSASNYVQRAGRAGRRIDATAYTLTYAQRRSHDLNHFAEPWRMVAGNIGVPYLKITNEKIIRRHLFAVVLSAFWKHHQGYFGQVENFFLQNNSGPELLKEFLERKPAYLKEALKRIIPAELQESLQIDNWGWIEDLLDAESGLLEGAKMELKEDINQLNQVLTDLQGEQKPSDRVLNLIKTIKRKPLLDFLSTRSIIPKYGFPVDVVELQLLHHGEDARRLKLDRDLRIALSEYAPSSEVVAGGKLWKSRYIRRSPRMRSGSDWEWESFNYAICEYCQSYIRKRAEYDEPIEECKYCHNTMSGHNKGTFIKPAYGFIASKENPGSPGEQRPEKTYSTRIYYSGEAKEIEKIETNLNEMVISVMPATKGKMAVINNAGRRFFKVCFKCGYALISDEEVKDSHPRPFGGECKGKLVYRAIGHEFETDLVQLRFQNYFNEDQGFWFSLLFAMLEGCSEALDIERQDLDGVLYPFNGDPSTPAVVIFDDVPGGAGHAHRIAHPDNLKEVLKSTLYRLYRCDCGGEEAETSCYGCLRHYRNQFCHEILSRGKVIHFLEKILG